jgi:NAD(P)-dependent dehydrogenase (short-subunit alcohol dehydrogenase family)
MGRHEGKVCVCVGSATGMGAETAERLAQEGARVAIGDLNIGAAQDVVTRIKAAGGKALAQTCDITDEASVGALFQAAAGAYGGVDLMHVNAADTQAVTRDYDALSTDLAVFDRSIAVNLRGHLLCTRAAIPLMLGRGKGAIVYTSSDAAKGAAPNLVGYYVSKAGLNALMRHVATRWGKEGVRANVVSPGFILTESLKTNLPKEAIEEGLARTPSPRLGEVRDIAAFVSFLLSDDAEWINGQAVSVNGGSVMGI